MKEDLKRIVEYGKDEIRKGGEAFLDFQEVFTKYFSRDYNLTCDTCGRGFHQAYDLLVHTYNNYKTIAMINPNSQFTFKAPNGRVNAVVLFCANKHKSYSNETLTDDVAILILKENPTQIIHFERYPDNWQEIVKNTSFPPSFADEVNAEKAAHEAEQAAEVASGEAAADDTQSETGGKKKSGGGKKKSGE